MRAGSSRRSRAIPYACISRAPFRGRRDGEPVELDGVAAEDPFAVGDRDVADGLPADIDDVRVRGGDETDRPIGSEDAARGSEPLEHASHVRRDVACGPALP